MVIFIICTDFNLQKKKKLTWSVLIIVVRTGIQITPNLFYNSIDMPSSASAIPAAADSIPMHIKTYWYCQGCRTTYSFNKIQATEHVLEKCSSLLKEDIAKDDYRPRQIE